MLYGDLASFSSAQLPPEGGGERAALVMQEAGAQCVGAGREMHSC